MAIADNTQPFARMGRKAYRVSRRQPGCRNITRFRSRLFCVRTHYRTGTLTRRSVSGNRQMHGEMFPRPTAMGARVPQFPTGGDRHCGMRRTWPKQYILQARYVALRDTTSDKYKLVTILIHISNIFLDFIFRFTLTLPQEKLNNLSSR